MRVQSEPRLSAGKDFTSLFGRSVMAHYFLHALRRKDGTLQRRARGDFVDEKVDAFRMADKVFTEGLVSPESSTDRPS